MKKQKVYRNIFYWILFIILIFSFIYISFQAIKQINESSVEIHNWEEIERKWLIDPNNIPLDLQKADIYDISQSYINYSPEIRIRKINNGEFYTLGIKTNMRSNWLVRDEVEYYITADEYEKLLPKKEWFTIHKIRYEIFALDEISKGRAIDIFQDDLKWLAYLEMEFETEEEANNFQSPNWVIRDVTDDVRYKNASLTQFWIPE